MYQQNCVYQSLECVVNFCSLDCAHYICVVSVSALKHKVIRLTFSLGVQKKNKKQKKAMSEVETNGHSAISTPVQTPFQSSEDSASDSDKETVHCLNFTEFCCSIFQSPTCFLFRLWIYKTCIGKCNIFVLLLH